MSNNKQSSVEWLVSQLKISTYWDTLIAQLELMDLEIDDIIEQAKAMHKEEITQAWKKGCKIGVDVGSNHDYHEGYNSEQYYNETYGGNK